MKFHIGRKRRAQALAKIRQWMISIGVAPNEPVCGYPAPAAVYALLRRKHGTGTYTVDAKKNLYHGILQILHKDDLQNFLHGQEVELSAEPDKVVGYSPVLDEEDKLEGYQCEACDKFLKTEKGIVAHIKKVH